MESIVMMNPWLRNHNGNHNDCNNDNYITNQDCSLYTHCGNDHQLIKQGDTCYCEDYIDCNEYFCTI